MKTIFTLLALFLLLQSCDLFVSPGRPKDINLQLKNVNQKGDYDKIHISGSANLFVQQGKKFKVVLKGNQDHFKYFILNVKNGVLVCKSVNGSPSNMEVEIQVTLPKLEEIDLSGAGNIVLNSFSNLDHLDLNLSGAGSFKSTGKTSSLKHLNISISGAGSVEAESLIAENVDVSVSGAGSAVVHAKKILNASVSGVGSIEYLGNPKVKKRVSGIGTISEK